MKTKYFLIYVLVGIAFLAVSAWVFFTRGKNAKAIRAKYKLGGIMLTCLAMLSVASCGEIFDPGEVTCYDPVIEEPTENIVTLEIKPQDSSYENYEISPGDIVKVSIQVPTYKHFVLKVVQAEGLAVLQRTELNMDDAADGLFEIPLSEEVTYKGLALIMVHSVVKEDPEELSVDAHGVMAVKIL